VCLRLVLWLLVLLPIQVLQVPVMLAFQALWLPLLLPVQLSIPPPTIHDTVPPTGAASVPVGDVEEEKENVIFWPIKKMKKKNQLKIMEVMLRLLRLLMRLSGPKIFFEPPGSCNLPHPMFLDTFVTLIILPWLNCCFSPMTYIQLMDQKAGMISP